mgnify:FL=1
MGIVTNLRKALALPAQAAALTPASPWAPGDILRSIVVPDPAVIRITRREAMSLPTIAKARRVICSAVAKSPLVLQKGNEDTGEELPWMSASNGPISPYHRMVWTVDDLLFYGWSLWAVQRDTSGAIVAADRVPMEDWQLTPEGQVTYQGLVVDPAEVILIPGIDEGILKYPDALLTGVNLAKGLDKAVRIPIPHTEIKQVGGAPLSDAEKNALIDGWISARQNPNGAVSFTNQSVEVKTHGTYDSKLLVEGVQSQAVQLAQLTGIPSIVLDAASSDGTMRYSNVEARNAELLDYCLDSFMGPIAARLGQDDVVPPGYSIAFDTSDLVSIPDDRYSGPDDEQGNKRTQ